MKNIIFCAAFLLAAFFAQANKPGSRINPCSNLQKSFEAQFGLVGNVAWYATINNLIRADFSFEGKTYSAYFDADKQYVATVRVVKLAEIPTNTFAKAKKMLPGYAISSVVEFWDDQRHVYFVEGRNESKRKICSMDASIVPVPLLTRIR